MLEDGAGGYKAILEHIRDRPTDGMLYHCSGESPEETHEVLLMIVAAGKDRTGVITAVILSVRRSRL